MEMGSYQISSFSILILGVSQLGVLRVIWDVEGRIFQQNFTVRNTSKQILANWPIAFVDL